MIILIASENVELQLNALFMKQDESLVDHLISQNCLDWQMHSLQVLSMESMAKQNAL